MIKITYTDPDQNTFTITPLWISYVPEGADEETGEGSGNGQVAVKKKIIEKEFQDLVNISRGLLRNTNNQLDEANEDSVVLKFENDDDRTSYHLGAEDIQLVFEDKFFEILDQ